MLFFLFLLETNNKRKKAETGTVGTPAACSSPEESSGGKRRYSPETASLLAQLKSRVKYHTVDWGGFHQILRNQSPPKAREFPNQLNYQDHLPQSLEYCLFETSPERPSCMHEARKQRQFLLHQQARQRHQLQFPSPPNMPYPASEQRTGVGKLLVPKQELPSTVSVGKSYQPSTPPSTESDASSLSSIESPDKLLK